MARQTEVAYLSQTTEVGAEIVGVARRVEGVEVAFRQLVTGAGHGKIFRRVVRQTCGTHALVAQVLRLVEVTFVPGLCPGWANEE